MTHRSFAMWAVAGALGWASAAGRASAAESAGLVFPGPPPGAATVATPDDGQKFVLGNRALRATWRLMDQRLKPGLAENLLSGHKIPAPDEAFVLEYRDGRKLKASALRVTARGASSLPANPSASCTAERFPGKQVAATLETKDGALRVEWSAFLRDGANYIRQQVVLRPLKGDADLARIVLVEHALPCADVCGQVPGSPVVAGNVFAGFEHPMAGASVKAGYFGSVRNVPAIANGKAVPCEEAAVPGEVAPLREGLGTHRVRCWLDRALPLRQGRTFTCSSVLGVVPEGQLRRGFLYYVERERAHAYRTFLHYNSWYDIGYFTPYAEADCLDVIHSFATELGEKRGVKLDSFLFDDGWDDKTRGGEWRFHAGFPQGFAPLKDAAAACGAGVGVWLSPWGGYGDPRKQRVASGAAAGYETDGATNEPGFALSGPKYYAQFHRACTEMVTLYGINQFKLDGTGNINAVVPGSAFGSDFEAAIQLIADLRALRPELFVNLTTGTWPSPFWLPICDSIWRGGWDHSFKGVGSARQRWITYRDGDTYERVVRGGPLYPINSLMLHGLIYAKHADRLGTDPENDFPREVRSYFAAGTQLQEMYVSHGLLSETNWNTIAECAKWSRDNAATLVDTHWLGGDPIKLQAYGWASWSPAKGILALRNPNDEPQDFTVELRKCFELPKGAAAAWTLQAPFKQRAVKELAGAIPAAKPVKVTLRPFEVLVFEAAPAK